MSARPDCVVNPAYRIETERLVLRCWAPTDAPRVRESLDTSDAHLRPWIPFMAEEPRSLSDTTRWLRGHRAMFDRDEHYRYAVLTRDEHTLLGEVMLLDRAGPDALELGYWIDVRHGRKGYATEATAALVHVALTLHSAARLELRCSPENAASISVAEKLGFTHEATLRQNTRNPAGAWEDSMVWTLFADADPGSVARSRVRCTCYDALGRLL